MATDGSKTSVRALKVAIEMAKKMGAKLALVGVIDNRLYVGRTMRASDSPTRMQEHTLPTRPGSVSRAVSSPRSSSGRGIRPRRS
jgi:nucleotide-binding universal stress UspA family protein